MNGHPQFEEDFDLYALGALDPEDKLAIESHIKGCATCASKLAAARSRVAMLALSLPPVDPPRRVKQRLMKRIKDHSFSAVRGTKSESWHATLWRQSAWALAAIAIIAALFLGLSNYRLSKNIREFRIQAQEQEATIARSRAVLELLTAPDSQRVILTAASEKPRPEGRVYYGPNRGLLFYASNLSLAPAGHVYQLWLVPVEGSPLSAGIFQPDDKGEASIVLPRLPAGVAAKAFAVTVEPTGGVPQPTGPKVLVGAS